MTVAIIYGVIAITTLIFVIWTVIREQKTLTLKDCAMIIIVPILWLPGLIVYFFIALNENIPWNKVVWRKK